MPPLGAHMSIAGGLHLAFDKVLEIGGTALQIFMGNERQWQQKELTPQSIETFRNAWKYAGSMPVAAHDSYLINLASQDEQILQKSIKAFSDSLLRASSLGIPYLVTHPGSHVGRGMEQGITTYSSNLDLSIERAEVEDVTVLLETTAGQGSCIGAQFSELAMIIDRSRFGPHFGICFDTCHVFAAGYDISDPEKYELTFREFDQILGVERLRFFHLNDSKRELGSRVDRHEHIGDGRIGLQAFRMLLNDPRFNTIPMVLETPKENGLEKDRQNLQTLRKLLPD